MHMKSCMLRSTHILLFHAGAAHSFNNCAAILAVYSVCIPNMMCLFEGT